MNDVTSTTSSGTKAMNDQTEKKKGAGSSSNLEDEEQKGVNDDEVVASDDSIGTSRKCRVPESLVGDTHVNTRGSCETVGSSHLAKAPPVVQGHSHTNIAYIMATNRMKRQGGMSTKERRQDLTVGAEAIRSPPTHHSGAYLTLGGNVTRLPDSQTEQHQASSKTAVDDGNEGKEEPCKPSEKSILSNEKTDTSVSFDGMDWKSKEQFDTDISGDQSPQRQVFPVNDRCVFAHNHDAQMEHVPDKTERASDPPSQHISIISQAIDNDFDTLCQAMENGIGPHELTKSSGGDNVERVRSAGRTLGETSGASEGSPKGTSICSAGKEVNDVVNNEDNPSIAPPLPRTEPSLPTDYLPVASPVPPKPERRRQKQQQEQEQNPNIPHATLQDPEEERKRQRCSRLCLASAVLLFLLGLVGIILGVTLRPSSSPAVPSEEPTPAPTSPEVVELKNLIKSVSFDGGAALEIPDSPQSRAFTWSTANANLDNYTDWKRIQRYVLAVFYYSTNGDKWRENDGWLSDDDECTSWFIQETSEEYPACRQSGSFAHITLIKNNLNGTLPAELALLSEGLYWLDLELNHLNGTIPTALGLLTGVEYFNVRSSALTGTVPTELALIGGGVNYTVSSIAISARGNSLTGTIPTEIFGMGGLGDLRLSENLLTGSIPTEVGLASNHMVGLGLFDNLLTGSLPTELGLLSLLDGLWLHQNLLVGTIPSEIGLLENLDYLYATDMYLSGTLPSEIGSLSKLARLRLEENTIGGVLPSELGNMSSLFELHLERNSFTGAIPTELGHLMALGHLWLTDNMLTGVIPTELGRCKELEVLYLSNNTLTGTFPMELTKLSSLVGLTLSYNPITGPLPSEVGLMRNLIHAAMDVNWTGIIPSEVGSMASLKIFALSGPGMDGTFPTEMGQLTQLELLLLQNLSVHGNIPSEIGSLSNLVSLDISTTNITGTIPLELMDLSNLINLYLHTNLITGTIPASIGNLSRLEKLLLLNNTLAGRIPSVISTMKNLEILWLNGNNFTGPFTCPNFIDLCWISCNNETNEECRQVD